MISTNKQTLSAGDASTNIQAQSVTMINNTIDASSLSILQQILEKQIASQVSVLVAEALETFERRSRDLHDGLITHISKVANFPFERLSDPGIQLSIYEAQKAYGASGEEGLKKTLLTLILRLCNSKEASLDRIYKDAIAAVPNITAKQLNAITAFHFMTSMHNAEIYDWGQMRCWVVECIGDLKEFPTAKFEMSHLEFYGFGSYQSATRNLLLSWQQKYAILFNKGELRGEIGQDIFLLLSNGLPAYVPCGNDSERMRPFVQNLHSIDETLNSLEWSHDEKSRFRDRISSKPVPLAELDSYIIHNCPELEPFMNFQRKIQLGNFYLSWLGTLVALLNLEEKTGRNLEITKWLLDPTHI